MIAPQTYCQQLKNRLQALRQQATEARSDVSQDLCERIADHEMAIRLTEQHLSGELNEAEWREALKSLAVDQPNAGEAEQGTGEKPRLELSTNIDFSPPTSVEAQQGWKRSWFIRLKIENNGQSPAKNCFGRLLKITDERGKQITRFDPLDLYWARQARPDNYQRLDIRENGDFNYLDIAQVKEADNVLTLRVVIPERYRLVVPGGFTHKPEDLPPGTYYAYIGIYTDNSSVGPIWFKIKWEADYSIDPPCTIVDEVPPKAELPDLHAKLKARHGSKLDSPLPQKTADQRQVPKYDANMPQSQIGVMGDNAQIGSIHYNYLLSQPHPDIPSQSLDREQQYQMVCNWDGQTSLTGFDLRERNLSHVDLDNADLRRVDLSRARLRHAKLNRTQMGSTILRQADLSWAGLENADLSDANLQEANLHKVHLLRGKLISANLHKADLTGITLEEADLTETNLTKADLSETNLKKAILRIADLRDANLQKADLSGADLSGANLSGADLSLANLSNVNLTGADLREADLFLTNLQGARYTNTTRWPENWDHKASKAINTDKLRNNQ